MDRMGEVNRRNLWEFIRHKKTLKLGTFCSGTDVAVVIFETFVEYCVPALEHEFGKVEFEF
eukprot:3268585-Pyramimonas_sp.AAC.1